jgi:hypothetical protein
MAEITTVSKTGRKTEGITESRPNNTRKYENAVPKMVN